MMAKKGKVRFGLRISLWLLVDIALVLAALFIFNMMGIIDIRATVGGIKDKISGADTSISEDLEGFNLLDSERLQQQLKNIDIKNEEIDRREKTIATKEQELNQRVAKLEEKEKALIEREEQLKKEQQNVEDEYKKVQIAADRFNGMAPEAAVKVFLKLPDDFLIKVFRYSEENAAAQELTSFVPVWLSLMPPERVAGITRKMLNAVE
jgi:flagellar motility protein MotE (MotC chaperone)